MRRAVAATALALALAGCGSNVPAQPVDSSSSVTVPEPPGVAGSPAPTTSTNAPDAHCDATASLRPSGPLPAPGQMPDGSTMARIVQRGRLIAGVDQNTYPMGFRDPVTGEVEGFDIDMLHAVSDALFGDPNRIQFKAITSADRIPALQQGQVDVVARTFTIDCARAQQVGFSTVYFSAGQRVLVDSDSAVRDVGDLSGKKVCATKGSTSLEALTEVASKPDLVSVDNWTDCLVLMQQGQADATSTDDTILAGLAAQDPYTKVVGPRFADEPYGLAVPKTDSDFVRFINAVLEKIRADGTWTADYKHWLGDRLGPVPAPPAPRYVD
ncbi:glutamate ABC transporter substrate-binding protein [Kutzneria sp. CA-103260]|uniref:glutamate ABC transporter substrate-binding protein n=1 Tax=Kutzneria sp. CA-103260 TaxID=2802641 RepID=UPI001BED65BD|nr:glutamate ABC transporter substrate-binding protein [Kutzneria sp. CA-103260]QUQ62631.1 ABC transporter substrate-binding protein [Kutzneria sp. CA-103260]